MEAKDKPKPKTGPRLYRVEGRSQSAAATLPPAQQQTEKGAGLSVGGAFLAGLAVGLVVADQAPHGEPAHVHLSLGDDSNSDTKDGKECDHDQGRDFDR